MFLGIPAGIWVLIGLFLLFCVGVSYCIFGRKSTQENDKELNPQNHRSTLEEAVQIDNEYQ